MNDKVDMIKVSDLHPFPHNPFGVRQDEAMKMLTQSVKEYGILSPLLARKVENGYEVISGHRRLTAAREAGLIELPVIVQECDRDQAVIMLVDSNLQRPELLPSEKAFAFKMKMEAMKHQGKSFDTTSTQAVSKLRTDEIVGDESGISRESVRRFIRLTNLEKPLLDLVDEGKIALTPAVELSFLSQEEQLDLLNAMEYEDSTPSYSQAVRMRKCSEQGALDEQAIYGIMAEEKANQKEKVSIRMDVLQKYFPRNYTARDMENTILRLLDDWQRQQNKRKDRDAR